MDRRVFLHRAVIAGTGAAVLPPWALSSAAGASPNGPAVPGDGPYGPLVTEPDENGLLLPEGFTSRVIARAGEPVGDTEQAWHAFPDGAACFETDDGGWIYTVNSEVFDYVAPAAGGVTAVRFAADGTINDAYRILDGSNSNCAGGPTPWGTWLSCEENLGDKGRVFECDPTGEREAVAHPAMGLFSHEAVAVDETSKTLYLTEDRPDGLLYRYTPDAYPDLAAGRLEAAVVADDGAVSWAEVPDPSGAETPTRQQVAEATHFAGGEGIWSHERTVYFSTKGDHTIHAIDLEAQTHQVIWKGDPDRLGVEGAVLSGVDNVTVDAGSGDLFVAEDGGNMEVVMITAEGKVAPFARIVEDGHDGSEVTGPCFNPARDRLYFSSQRGPSSVALGKILSGLAPDADTNLSTGVTYEVTGPFRGIGAADSSADPTTTLAKAAEGGAGSSAAKGDGDKDDDPLNPLPFLAGGALIGAAIGGALAVRNRRRRAAAAADTAPTEDETE